MAQKSVPLWAQKRQPRNNHGQDEEGRYSASFNTNNYESSNLVFITAASEEDLGFDFEDTEPLPLVEKNAVTAGGEVFKVEMDPGKMSPVSIASSDDNNIPWNLQNDTTGTQPLSIKKENAVSAGGEVIKVEMDPFTMSPVAIFSSDYKNPRPLPRSLQNATTETRKVGKNQVKKEKTSSSDLEEIDTSSPSCAADYEFECEDTEPMRASTHLVSSSVVVQNTKSKSQSYQCQFCKKSFSYLSHKSRHEKSHTGDKPHICKYCEKAFSTSSVKNRHERIHLGQKQFACELCQQKFSQKIHLTDHILWKHAEGKTYACHLCDKHFATPGGRRRHERSHGGEKPHKCNLCNKTFTESSSLSTHIRFVHKKERPFSCSICGKGFCTSKDQKRHEQGCRNQQHK